MKEFLEEEGKRIVEYIRMRLREEDKISSGSLYDSISYEVIENDGSYELLIKSNDYLKYIESGRKPGSFPPIDKIKKWIKEQRINFKDKKGKYIKLDQKAFIISRSIKEKGIKPTKIYPDPMIDMNKLKEEIKKEILTDINNLIKKEFK